MLGDNPERERREVHGIREAVETATPGGNRNKIKARNLTMSRPNGAQSRKLVDPPEGGWGWIIVFYLFMVSGKFCSLREESENCSRSDLLQQNGAPSEAVWHQQLDAGNHLV